MMNLQIPFGKTHFPLNFDGPVLEPESHHYQPEGTESQVVVRALETPIGTPRLCDLAEGKKRVLVITSDHTRPVPSKKTLPLLLEELRRKNPDAEVKILIATGFHRPTSKEEMLDKFGPELVEREIFINHISTCQEDMRFYGIMPSGGELWLNKLVEWADLVVSEGFIEPHFFAGFSGGRKSILPGIASAKTVLANHCSEFISSDKSTTGNLQDNPIHRDMLFAAQKAGLDFILNVVLDADKNIIGAFAGDSVAAHEEGCAFVRSLAKISATPADIVITSNGGYPLDQNIYQAVKGMTAAEACVNSGGVIIMSAACEDGHGGEGFYRWFSESASPQETLRRIEGIGRSETLPDQWTAQILARILTKAAVILVAKCPREMVESMHMRYAEDLNEAIAMAKQMVPNGTMAVIPDGVSVIVEA